MFVVGLYLTPILFFLGFDVPVFEIKNYEFDDLKNEESSVLDEKGVSEK